MPRTSSHRSCRGPTARLASTLRLWPGSRSHCCGSAPATSSFECPIEQQTSSSSFPRLCPELLEPILHNDQLVGCDGLQRPNHQEALVVWGHRILGGESEGRESRGRKECCGALERKSRIRIYFDDHEVPG